MNEVTKQELILISKKSKTERSYIFDEIIEDDEIIYCNSSKKCFRLRFLDGDVSRLIVVPQWVKIIPSLVTLDYARQWEGVWKNASYYNIYITRPELVTNMVLEFSVVDEETFNIVGERSIHKIESVEQLNALLDSYLLNINL